MLRSAHANVKAVLMDIDGTLLDSADAQAHCWLHVLRDFGYAVDFRQVRSRIGTGPDRMLRELCGVSEASARARRLLPIRALLLRSRELPTAHTFPAAHTFLRRVQQTGAQLGIVTSAYRSEALALLGAARLLTEFDHVVCREDVRQTKPSADGISVALDRMGVRPEHALMIASSPYDLAAARAARVPFVALRSGGWPESALLGGSPIYDDLGDLLDHWEEPPQAMASHPIATPPPFLWPEPGRVRRGNRPSNPATH